MSRWPKMRLGDLVDLLSGFAFDSERFADTGDLPLVRIRDVVTGKSTTFYRGDYDEKYIIHTGDVLIGMDGDFNRARWLGGDALLNQRVCRIVPASNELDDRYLFYFLPEALKKIERATPFVTVKHLSTKQIRDIAVPLPPIVEQQRIAEILEKADALRAKRRTAIAQLDTLTRSIFLDMFGDPATNPMDWLVVSLADICEVKGGKRLPKGEEYSSVPTRFRYIRVIDLRDGRIDESALVYLKPETQAEISRYVVNTGDVIISIAGSIGLVAPVPETLNGVNLTENAAKLVPTGVDKYEAEYLASVLQTKHVQGQISSHVGQVTIGKLALFRIEKLKIPLPPVALQREFVRRVAAVESHSEVQRESRARLDELFASLQGRAFLGAV
jgi:type I restriction enzyme S subunit